MRTIIAGGRDYRFTVEDKQFLDSIASSITEVVNGGAPGADLCARIWARKNNIPVKLFPAQWKQHGRAAGPIRNEQMAVYAAEENGQCILFPGGTGTQSMYNMALKYKLTIIDRR